MDDLASRAKRQVDLSGAPARSGRTSRRRGRPRSSRTSGTSAGPGVLKNRLRTSITVPDGTAAALDRAGDPRLDRRSRSPRRRRPGASGSGPWRPRRSPPGPRPGTRASAMRNRSSASASLLVAWGWNARGRSSGAMPRPLSATRTRSLPPRSTVTSTRVAPASIAFSSSSLTTLDGRSTTSPAAIWLMTDWRQLADDSHPTCLLISLRNHISFYHADLAYRKEQATTVGGRAGKASGEWRVASGEWRVASGEWRVASGEWRVASDEWPARRYLSSANCHPPPVIRHPASGICHLAAISNLQS